MKKTVIALDVDGVLRMNLGTISDIYNRNFGQNISEGDWKSYDVGVVLPEIEKQTGIPAAQWLFQDHSEEIFRDAPAYDRASACVAILRKIADVVIITYQRSMKNKIHTMEFLENNMIGYEGLYFTKDKSMLKCDWLVDDNPANFIGCNARCGALISAPYNMDADMVELKRLSGCEQLVRFASLSDFVDSIIGWLMVWGEKPDGSRFFVKRFDAADNMGAAAKCVEMNALHDGNKYYIEDRTFSFS